MRRIKLVLATLVMLVAALAAFSGPAVAQQCEDAWGYLIECDGEYYAPVSYDDDDYNGDYSDYSPFYGYEDNPFYGYEDNPFYGYEDNPFYDYEDNPIYNIEDYEDADEFVDAVEDYYDDREDSSLSYFGW